MASRNVILFTIFVSFTVFQFATGLKCYQCGVDDTGCNDPFPESAKKVYGEYCDDKQNNCLKIVHPEDGDCWLRTCGVEDDCLKFEECYSCTGELCNSSTNIVSSYLIVALFSAILIKYWQ